MACLLGDSAAIVLEREFEVVQSEWLAESGAGSAGSINVVTKSGANTLHGDAFVFGQSGVFNAAPKLEESLASGSGLRRYRAGAAVGGPISRDRAFYYAAAEREGTDDRTASNISPAAASAINHALDDGLLPEIGTAGCACSTQLRQGGVGVTDAPDGPSGPPRAPGYEVSMADRVRSCAISGWVSGTC